MTSACFTSPHIIYFVISLVAAMTFILIAFCMAIADFDLNPLTTRLLSSPQTLVEVRCLFARTVMVIASTQLYGQPNLVSIIYFLLTFFLFWSFVRWQPSYNPWVNHVRSGLFAILAWASMLLLALTNGPRSQPQDAIKYRESNLMVAYTKIIIHRPRPRPGPQIAEAIYGVAGLALDWGFLRH